MTARTGLPGALLTLLTLSTLALPAAATDAPVADAALRARLAAAAMPFQENAGQYDPRVRFAAPTFAGTLFVTGDGALVYAPGGRRAGDAGPAAALTETFVGGRVQPQGGTRHPARAARFVGRDPARHQPDIALFESVSLGEVFAGIDVRLRATGTNAEKIFTVRPHADPARIRLAFPDAADLAIDADGSLRVRTAGGPVAFTAPVAFQTIDGTPRPVPVRYALTGRAGEYGFDLGDYDAELPLVIDPLLQSSYLGGSGDFDKIATIASSPFANELIVAGTTNSTDLPCTTAAGFCDNAARPGSAGGLDGMVARFQAGLIVLLQVTYFGGSGSDDEITSLAVHPLSGEIVVGGITNSTDLPCTTPGGGCTIGARPSNGGDYDGFVARFNPALTSLLQATYLGGTGTDTITALAIHPNTGEIIVAGNTSSGNFPCVSVGGPCGNGARTTYGGGATDGFVARFNASLTTLMQSTYFGGSGIDAVTALAVHPGSGEVLVAGYTNSPSLPCTTVSGGCGNGARTGPAGGMDGWVARFNPFLTTLLQSTYLGGGANDQINALAVHPLNGQILVAGETSSGDFPCSGVINGCAVGVRAGEAAIVPTGFVALLNPGLTSVFQALFLGGSSGASAANAVVAHPVSGEIYVGGRTFATDLPCTASPCLTGAQTASGGSQDGFIVRLNIALNRIIQATYLGGSGSDEVIALAVSKQSGYLYAGGLTTSFDFPCTAVPSGPCTLGGQSVHAGAAGTLDGFVSFLTPSLAAANMEATRFNWVPVSGATPGAIVTSPPVVIAGIPAGTPIHADGAGAAAYCVSTTATCSCDASGGQFIGVPSTINQGQSVCVRHQAALSGNTITRSIVHIGSMAAHFTVTTGALIGGCTLDVDGNGTVDVLTDGLLILRAMFGLTGAPLTNGALGTGAARTDPADVIAYLGGICGSTPSVRADAAAPVPKAQAASIPLYNCLLDIDGNGTVDALTDGLIFLRAMFGLTGPAVTAGAVGANATRGGWADVRTYLNGNCGRNFAP